MGQLITLPQAMAFQCQTAQPTSMRAKLDCMETCLDIGDTHVHVCLDVFAIGAIDMRVDCVRQGDLDTSAW